MKYLLNYSKYSNLLESTNGEFSFKEYTVPPPGILASHNYSGELHIFPPFFLADGKFGNPDYGDQHKVFLIIPGTKIVTIRASEDIQKVDLSGLNMSNYSIDKMNDLWLNRAGKKLYDTNFYKGVPLSCNTLINWANNRNDEYAYYMANQFTTLEYLKQIEQLDFQIIEFTREEELVPHQYMVLDLNSISEVDNY